MRRDEGGMNVMDRDQDIKTNKDPVSAVTRKEKELTRLDLERARDGNDLAETFGRQNIGPATASRQILENKKKEDEKFERAVRQLLQQMREELERRLEELHRLIAESNDKIGELREELEATEILLEKKFGKDWQDKLKRGDLNVNDPLLRQWLLQQQQLKDYLERRERLIKERNELEERVAEIEGSNLPDYLKLERMKEVLEQGTAPGVQEVWRDTTANQRIQEIAGAVNTTDIRTVESLEAGTMFAQIADVSFAGKAGIGEGIESKVEAITSKFEKAVEGPTTEKLAPVTASLPSIKDPKTPG